MKLALTGHGTPEEEFEGLKDRFGGSPRFVERTIEYANARFFQSRQSAYRSERRGEVVFAVERPSRCFVVTRMREYPQGIFRLPSGGISYGEETVPALEREILEELGLTTTIVSFLGTVKYEITHGAETAGFASYVFHVRETGGCIMQDAQDDEVSEFIEVQASELWSVAQSLRSIGDSWRDWGNFRALAVEFTAEALGVSASHQVEP